MSTSLCIFRVQDTHFGVDVQEVAEVLGPQFCTPIFGAPPMIAGLFNLRGQVVTSLDLRRRLQMPERDPDDDPVHVVLRTEEGLVSLMVDEAGDVLQIDQSTFEEPPRFVSPLTRRLLRGVLKLQGKLLLILDAKAAVDIHGDAKQA